MGNGSIFIGLSFPYEKIEQENGKMQSEEMDLECKSVDFPSLTTADKDRMIRLNASNGYGINAKNLFRLAKQHSHARKKDDRHTMELIEYRLTHINFHHEAGMLQNGRYEELQKEIRTSW